MKKADGGFCLHGDIPLFLIEAKRVDSNRRATDLDIEKLALGCKFALLKLRKSGKAVTPLALHVNGKY